MSLPRKAVSCLRAHTADLVTLAVMALLIAASFMLIATRDTSFQMLTANGTSYPAATVLEVTAESLSSEEGTDRYLGSQTLRVRLDSGEYAGEEVEVENSLTATHNVLAKQGGHLIIKVERQEGVTPYYSVYNYDRLPGIVGLIAVYALAMAIVGGTKGLRSLAGLAFALIMVVGVLLPALYSGLSALPTGLVVAAAIAVLSMLLLNGWTRKTVAAIVSTVGGLVAAMVVYLVFSSVLNVSGFNQEGAEELIIIQQATNLDVRQVLFIGVLVASLGAVMDMCMSIATSLFEIKGQRPSISTAELIASAFNIGRDMIGTMCQTLVLAFAGSSLTSLLVLMAYGVDFNQLLSSDYLAIELLHSFVGGIAVVLCVPITALACSACTRHRE